MRKGRALAVAAVFMGSLALGASTGRALKDDSFDTASAAGSAGRLKGFKAARLAPAKPPSHGAAAAGLEADPRSLVTAQAAGARERSRVAAAGVAIEGIQGGVVIGIAAPHALARLRALGIPFKARPLSSAFSAGAGGSNGASVLQFPSADSAYHDYARMAAALRALEASGIAKVFSMGRSLEGRDVVGVRINTSAKGMEPSRKPGILFMGTHHAREHLSTEVPLMLAQYLVENKSDPDLAKLIASRDIYIVPMVNPDGVEYDIQGGRYHMWRKNRSKNSDGTRGVDLNRNYDSHWGESGTSQDPSDETYGGTGAFSEPETRNVRDFVLAHPNLKMLLSYHTFSELILYPWGYADVPLGDSQARGAFEAIARRMASMTGYTPEQAAALYPASGDTCDWAWTTRRVFAFTFELSPKSEWAGGFYPGAGAITATFQKNIAPAVYMIGLADDPYRAAAGSKGG